MVDVFGAIGDGFSRVTGIGETRAEEHQRLMAEAATAASQKRSQQLAQQQQGLQIEGTDPASITQHDNWNNWDHARLYNQLRESLQPKDINESGDAWIKLGEEIAEIFADLEPETRKAAGDQLQGEAAEAGLSAAKPLQDWGQKFGDSLSGTGYKIQEAGNAAAQTKATLEPPKEFDGLRNGIRSLAPGGGIVDGAQQMMEQREAEQQARQLVQNVYASGYQAVDTSTPTFPPPVDPLNPPPPPDQGRSTPQGISSTPSGISGQPSGSVTGGGSVSGGGGVTGGGSVPGGGLPGGGYTPPAQSGSQWAGQQPNVPGPGLGVPSPGSTPPGGGGGGFLGAMPPGGPGGPGAGGRGAGGLGGAGARGAGAGGMGAGGRAGAGGPGGPGMGAGGRAGVGGLGAGGAGGVAGGGAAGGRGAGGGMGAGAGAGQRGQGSEDQEHDRPSWLEEQDDIWLDDMPKTAPPVFGDWGK